MENEYTKQGKDFLVNSKTRLDVVYLRTGNFFGDSNQHDIYNFSLTNENGSYSGEFGDSVANTSLRRSIVCDRDMVAFRPKQSKNIIERKSWEQPNAYDILSCMTAYDPESFKDFCDSYGYDSDSISALKTYKAVKAEYEGMRKLFNDDQLNQLAEIA